MDAQIYEERKKGIGGSDAPAVLGVSPWCTPYQVYLEKTGQIDRSLEDSESMFWGRTLEPVIRQRYADVTGRRVIIPDRILRHPGFGFMIGNLDGIAQDNRVLEVKTARTPEGWGEPGSNEIPDPYMIQVQHYMAITAFPVAD
jgi:putative phage-type endonuclease